MGEDALPLFSLTVPVSFGKEILMRYEWGKGKPFVRMVVKERDKDEEHGESHMLTLETAEMLGQFLVSIGAMKEKKKEKRKDAE